MNKLEYDCLCWRLNGKNDKTLIALNVYIYIYTCIYIYILHLKKKQSHQGNLKQCFKPSFDIVLINYGSVGSNYNINMTIINKRMFGIMLRSVCFLHL